MSEQAVLFELVEDHIGLLTLNRPEHLNALNREMVEGLLAVLQRLEADRDIRALVVTGSGKAFCAGGDLHWLVQAQDTGAQRIILEKAEELIIRLERISLPVIAGVNGVAAGAGTALAMACDLAIASKMATFAPNFVSIGAVPDSGVSWYLPRRIGRQKAAELLLTGKRLSAEEAAELGLYASVEPMDDFRQALMAKAREIARGPQRAVRSIKKLLKLCDWNTLEAQMEAEASLQMAAWSEADFAEGVQAFREGRSPRFGSSPYPD